MLDWSLLDASVFLESELTENSAFYASYSQSLLQSYNQIIDLKAVEGKKATGFNIEKLPRSSNYQSRFNWQGPQDQSIALTLFGARDSGETIFQENNNLVIKDVELLGKASINKGFDAQLIEWRTEDRRSSFLSFFYGESFVESRPNRLWPRAFC